MTEGEDKSVKDDGKAESSTQKSDEVTISVASETKTYEVDNPKTDEVIINETNEGSTSKTNDQGVGKSSEESDSISMNLDDLICYPYGDMIGYYMPSEQWELTGKVDTDKTITKLYYEVIDYYGNVVRHEEIAVSKDWVIERLPLTIPGAYVKVCATLSDGSVLTCEEWFHNFFKEKMEGLDVDMSDADNDGLEAYIEMLLGSDPNNADEDNDGLNDYVELAEIGTNPHKVDSDDNGIPDGDEDTDKDGLTNIEEVRLGTDTWAKFTDDDLLSDYEEVKVYGTDPLNPDTDGDGMDDYEEVKHGYNPLVYDKVFDKKISADGMYTSVDISVKAETEKLSTLSVKPIEEDIFINDTIPGYIGSGYDFTMDGTFESAELTYYFSPSCMETEGFNPKVYYYDEENHELIPVDTVWDHESSYVTAKLEHFSSYILLDSNVYDAINMQILELPMYLIAKTGRNMFYYEFSGKDGQLYYDRDTETRLNTFSIGKRISNRHSFSYSVSPYHYTERYTYSEPVYSWEEYEDENGEIIRKHVTNYYWRWTWYTYYLNKPDRYDHTTDYKCIMEKLKHGLLSDSVCYLVLDRPGSEILLTEPGIEFLKRIRNAKVYIIGEIDERIFDYLHCNMIVKRFDDIEEYKDEFDFEAKSGAFVFDVFNEDLNPLYRQMLSQDIFSLTTHAFLPEGVKEKLQDDPTLLKKYVIRGSYRGLELVIPPEEIAELLVKEKQEKENQEIEIEYDIEPDYCMQFNYADTLFEDDLYISGYMANDYLSNEALRMQIAAGNFFLNMKVSDVEQYKMALSDAIRVLNETMVEKKAKEYLYMRIDAVNSYAEDAEEIADIIKDLKNAARDTETMIDINVECFEKFGQLCNKSISEYNYAQQLLLQAEKEEVLANMVEEIEKFNKKYAGKMDLHHTKLFEKTDRFVVKLRKIDERIPYKLKKYGKIGLDALIIFSSATDIYTNLGALSAIYGQSELYDEYADLIKHAYHATNNSSNKKALREIMNAMDNERDKFNSYINTIIKNALSDSAQFLMSGVIDKIGNPLLVAMELGLSIGDFIFHTGSLDECAIHTIAIGDLANSIADYIQANTYQEKGDHLNTWFYGNFYNQLSALCQLRIVAENYAYETVDEMVIKIDKKTEEEEKENIIENIKRVREIIKEHDFNAKVNYKGSNVHVN